MRLSALLSVALLTFAVAGCDDQGPDPDDGGSSNSEGSQVTDGGEATTDETDFRATDVKRAFLTVSMALQTQQLTPRFGYASYSVCEGGEADTFVDTKYAYTAQGRADYLIGQTGSAQAARDVVAALESAGWTPRDDGWADDGIHSAGTDRWSIYVSMDGLDARVEMYATEPIVLMSVSGPCIEPPGGNEPSLASKDLEIPGAVPLTDGPNEDEDGRPLPGA
jgi:hypothetical protein